MNVRQLMMVAFAFSIVALATAQSHAQQPDEHMQRAQLRAEAGPLIDGHNDLPWVIRQSATGPRDVGRYDLRKTVSGHTDVARLTRGMVGAQFWSVYTPVKCVIPVMRACNWNRLTSPDR